MMGRPRYVSSPWATELELVLFDGEKGLPGVLGARNRARAMSLMSWELHHSASPTPRA